MKRYQDEHVIVTLSDEGLRRAANDNALLTKSCARNERLVYVIGLPICLALCVLVAWSAAFGN
jgi:hypothetical protein